VSLPPPVALEPPDRVRRVTRATRPPRIRRKQPRGRRAVSAALLAGIVGLVVLAIVEDSPERERASSPIVSIPTIPTTAPPFVAPCFTTQRPGLTATADVVRALVGIRAESARFPQSDCRDHVWASDPPPPVDDFGTLGLVFPPVTITDVVGAPTATAGDTVQFTVSDFRTRGRFETQLARSPDGSEWRLAYLRRI
jgi:hypothetical protein